MCAPFRRDRHRLRGGMVEHVSRIVTAVILVLATAAFSVGDRSGCRRGRSSPSQPSDDPTSASQPRPPSWACCVSAPPSRWPKVTGQRLLVQSAGRRRAGAVEPCERMPFSGGDRGRDRRTRTDDKPNRKRVLGTPSSCGRPVPSRAASAHRAEDWLADDAVKTENGLLG